MKIVCVSDTHGKHRELDMPEGNVLIFAGDCSMGGEREVLYDFNEWMNDLPYQRKLWTFGNHEWTCDPRNRNYSKGYEDIITAGTKLHGSSCVIDGIKIYGSPFAPRFHGWAFGLESYESFKYWKSIPEDADVVVTHGPAFGILDQNPEGEHCGCPQLRERLKIVRPVLHVFGHIHTQYGEEFYGGIRYINASVVDDRYQLIRKPIVVDI